MPKIPFFPIKNITRTQNRRSDKTPALLTIFPTWNQSSLDMRAFLLLPDWGEGIYHKYLLIDQTRSHGKGEMHNIGEITYRSVKNNEIVPRFVKSKEDRKNRTKNKGEVFTPLHIIAVMNDSVDENYDSCVLEDYINQTWLEITCGEAPFMVSRYHMDTGEPIPFEKRQGFIDRKLRKINQSVYEMNKWQELVISSYKASYGFEWSADSILLARENLLFTYFDYFIQKWNLFPSRKYIEDIARIISYNVFQMDGLTGNIPLTKTPALVMDWEKGRFKSFSVNRSKK